MNLKKGDTIGIVATSGGFEIDRFNDGIKIIEEMGYNVLIPPAVYEKEGYLAGSDSLRLKTLTEMFLNKDVKAIFCARGGYGAQRIIDKIDFDLIYKNPKPFIGFSDVTSLLIAFHEKSKLKTYHGPVVTSLNLLERKNIERIFSVLSLKKEDSYSIKSVDPFVINSGICEGELIGGNLCILSHMIGTIYQPNLNNKIMFIEDIGEPLYKIDRMLTHLHLSGLTNNIKGLILGSFKNCGDMENLYKLVEERFIGHNIPILAGMGFGHGNINEIIPIGSYGKLQTDTGTLKIKL
ncbi:MAG: LD-carboxypeptidase [Desulfobacterales bacterium]|nr:LD-carboxypeptidase [Desulfobacterales bacterium]MCP4162377.1 LD-carboxypeptidase [Deltaproteobacteria bacterium]